MRFDPSQYVDVQTRIAKFWEMYPEGAIVTEFLSDPDNLSKVLIQARVYKSRGTSMPDATGLAFEVEGGFGANQTSHVENGETSSIGRALANLGLKTRPDEPRPSREEMEKVNRASSAPSAGVGVELVPAGRLDSLFSKRS